MKIAGPALTAALERELAPLYLLSGDEPLLIEEALDAIRQAARARGFSERESHVVDKSFDFDALFANTGTLSLFASQRLLELRFTGNPNREAQAALNEQAERLGSDTVLVITLPKLDRKEAEAKWLQALEQRGSHVTIASVGSAEISSWLQQRLRAAGLQAEPDALALLVQLCEGNLLAAHQLISQLVLLFPGAKLTAEQISSVAADNARYNLFELMDTALRGDGNRCLRMLHGLRHEDEQGNLRGLFGLLHRDIRALVNVAHIKARGQRIGDAWKEVGVFSSRLPLFERVAARLGVQGCQQQMQRVAQLDQQIKGVAKGEPWLLLEAVLMSLAAVSVPTA
ncbi:DNA polymerase III subunit delta [Permianibacter sp. IMCC34836]|uniref:DNA polymerase III subunit delta n=1 Tax=Permianibacter fluminis TaxID=2738515 RepID=UPI0015531243|nr:DNA polymerase III subunit delta [Permianibacter fluminis]NQD36628.1 DNA polymerase III subunit delta [Permianibacter fluminis]